MGNVKHKTYVNETGSPSFTQTSTTHHIYTEINFKCEQLVLIILALTVFYNYSS